VPLITSRPADYLLEHPHTEKNRTSWLPPQEDQVVVHPSRR